MTQGGPLSPRYFNIMVDVAVREWMHQYLGDEAAKIGYGARVCQFLEIIYAGDEFVAARDLANLQIALDIL